MGQFNRRMQQFGIAGLALTMAGTAPPMYARGDKGGDAVRAKIEAVNSRTALEQEGVRPWYLKLDVQLYLPPDPLALPGAPAKHGERGTIEEWWASPTMYRVVYDFPSYKAVEGSNAGGRYRSAGFTPVPPAMQMVRRQVVHPMPTDAEMADQLLQQRRQDFAGATYNCLMVTRPLLNVPFPAVGLFPSYCVKDGTEDLVASLDYGSRLIPRIAPSSFEGKAAVGAVIVQQGNRNEVAAKVVTLKEIGPVDENFAAPAGAEKVAGGEPVPVPANVMKGQLIHRVAVHIDDSRQRPSGVYTARVVIGTDGRVESLRTISGAGVTASASEAALAQYVYKPYLVDGRPNEVLTTVTLEY